MPNYFGINVFQTSGKQLPEWGYHQYEVVTDTLFSQPAAVWNVEEHRYTISKLQKLFLQKLTIEKLVSTSVSEKL